jgi:hypothetical protein
MKVTFDLRNTNDGNISWNEEEVMKTIKFSRSALLLTLALVGVLILSGCVLVTAISGLIPGTRTDTDPEATLPVVFGPEAARQTALDFLQNSYGSYAPPVGANWVGGEMPSDGLVGSTRFQYTAAGWVVSVSYPLVAPEATLYTVDAVCEAIGFSWQGLVDASGKVATVSLVINEPSATPEVIEPSETPAPDLVRYQDESYKLALAYPSDWSLSESSLGSSGAKALKFTQGNWVLLVQYKFKWDGTALGGGLPAGDVTEQGFVELLDRAIPRKVLVYQGKDKVVFYGDRFDDLEIFLRLDQNIGDYNAVDIPESIMAVMDGIAASMVRTGSPAVPATPTPKPTATPIPRPCNAVRFVADVRIPDGTTFGPNTEFIKTWRLENAGTCNWTSDYDLIFVDGNRMEARKAIELPGWVKPGERVDLSVTMQSPDDAGDYRGFWMLRSDDGEVFGLGPAANKAFWVSITVVEPPEDYTYDFAFYFCQATWRSDEGRLSCTESGNPDDGFVHLLDKPAMENRRDNELALWVHPNEERYGWIEGTYPDFEVESGDHFLAWVGCLDGYPKCSLKFYLDYENEDGKVRRLGEWVEEYDGKVTEIDLDLSALAGESVRFILGTEALTHNTDAAQGFWFVPRID